MAVLFGSQGITDNIDLMRAMILCTEICRQGTNASVETSKKQVVSKVLLMSYQKIIDW